MSDAEQLISDASEAIGNIDYCWQWITEDDSRRVLAEKALAVVVDAWKQIDALDPVPTESRFPHLVSFDQLADQEYVLYESDDEVLS